MATEPKEADFVIGPSNTWPQAWQALLAGHPVRRASWAINQCLVLEGDAKELVQVYGKTRAEWLTYERKHWPFVSVNTMLLNDWEVLPQIDAELLTI